MKRLTAAIATFAALSAGFGRQVQATPSAGASVVEDPPEPKAAKTIEQTRQIGLLAGLLQPIVIHGGNLQLEAAFGRLAFDYSHGWSLDIPTAGDAGAQKLSLHLPYSTGFGVGYRLTDSFDVRFEPKIHLFEVGYEDGGPKDAVASYRTVTLGVGAYYKYRPFKSGPLGGLTIAPSARFWPNVWSSLEGGKVTYANSRTGRSEVHEASNIGIGNSPFLVNVSVGYVFSL